jgi:hypothetical protein
MRRRLYDIKHFLVTRDVTRRKTTVIELGTDYETPSESGSLELSL